MRLAGGRLVDTVGAEAFLAALAADEPRVDAVVVTRLAVTYEALASGRARADRRRGARARGAVLVADDAGGARVGPAVLGQPRTLELGVDVGATGLDKYGVTGPAARAARRAARARRRDPGPRDRARARGAAACCSPPAMRSLEHYRPERVRELVATTQELGDALERRLGAARARTPFTLKLRGEEILAAGVRREASCPSRRPPRWRCSSSATTAS